MKYYSLNFNSKEVSFLEAVVNGLAPDRGLYFPKEIPKLPESFFANIQDLNDAEIAYEAIAPFVGDAIPSDILKNIVSDTLNFEFPLVPITDNVSSLELFHGPTMAFKDVGARFMARCLAYFNSLETAKKVIILVATSGDTGGAVADGFYDVEGIDVVILYPKGKVSPIQEKQLTTHGKNITALEVDGVFDDCQDMVKTAFIDPEYEDKIRLTSANSINIARWLSQMFYYFITYKKLAAQSKPIVFSVPSGNFGNLCAGLVAKLMGLPINHFIASTNVNDTVPRFLETGTYDPLKSVPTISNAMDVGEPSNFIRIQKLFNNDFQKLKKVMSGFRFTDSETKKAMKSIFEISDYISDPHGAVGYLGLQEFLEEHPDHLGVFLETAHPIKFAEIVEKTLKIELPIPQQIKSIMKKEKKSTPIQDYADLKAFLLDRVS